MSKRIIVNPFSVFFLVILSVILLSSLSWSTLIEPLGGTLLVFFIFVLVSLLFFSKLYNYFFPPGTFQKPEVEMNLTIWIIIGLGLMLADFAYEGVIPIVEILIKKNGYNYVDFEGIPAVHVIAVTFASFLGLYCWSVFLKKPKIVLLMWSLFFTMFPLMLFNRGGAIMNIISMFMIFLFHKTSLKISIKNILLFVGVLLIGLYVFGLFGNIRSDSENASKDITDSSFILRVGHASEGFKKSDIPKPLFWGYLYASTPIGNLQHMVENMEPINDSTLFLTQSVIPDFIAKRLEEKIPQKVPEDQLLYPVFNVSTMFASAYKTLGYFGLVLVFYYFVGFVFLYSLLMKKLNIAKSVGISILMTITIFNLFSNMLTFSGLSFQLIYPLVFWLYKKL